MSEKGTVDEGFGSRRHRAPGNAIVRALLERHFEVIATGRRDAPLANLAGLPVHYMEGDADIAHLYLEVKQLIESQILDAPFFENQDRSFLFTITS